MAYKRYGENVKMTPKYPFIGSYRHMAPYARGNPYYQVRKRMGLTQAALGALMGCTWQAIQYREKSKRLFHIMELVVLADIAEMSDTDFMKMLRDIA